MPPERWRITTAPAQFDEAIEAFRARVPMSKEAFEALTAKAKQRAFTIAGVAQLDLVADAWTAIEAAIADGLTVADFKAKLGPQLSRAWGLDPAAYARRIDTIFRTNVQAAYSAGRWEQLTDPDALDSHPFWTFDAVIDDRTTTVCEECDGTTLRADSSWWATHNPPLHFSCRSGILPLSVDSAHVAGITAKPPRAAAGDGFGLSPGRDDDWVPDERDYPPELWGTKAIKK